VRALPNNVPAACFLRNVVVQTLQGDRLHEHRPLRRPGAPGQQRHRPDARITPVERFAYRGVLEEPGLVGRVRNRDRGWPIGTVLGLGQAGLAGQLCGNNQLVIPTTMASRSYRDWPTQFWRTMRRRTAHLWCVGDLFHLKVIRQRSGLMGALDEVAFQRGVFAPLAVFPETAGCDEIPVPRPERFRERGKV